MSSPEHDPKRAASEVGGLLAVGIAAVTVHVLSPAGLDDWGWRIPFLAGAAVAAGIWLARSAMAAHASRAV